MKLIKVFYDLETTGVNPRQHSIHQIAGYIEVNGKVVEEFNLHAQPNPKAKIEPEALKIGGIDELDLEFYPTMAETFATFKEMLSKYIDKYDTKQKAHLVGYNNRFFDVVFLRAWFEQNGDKFIGSWFWNDTIDVLVLASQYLLHRRHEMPSFKLKRVAKELGIDVDESKLHDAFYDVDLTHRVYNIVTDIDLPF